MLPERTVYESDWRKYAFPEQAVRFSTEEELARAYTPVRLIRGGSIPAGGLPVWSNGTDAILNTENEMTMIFGGTASKKTRTLVAPLIAALAQAGESMVLPDIKGELSSGEDLCQIRGILEERGYDIKYFNLRDQDGDAFNFLWEPYRLYRSGSRDQAVAMVGDIVDALASIYKESKADPFWEQTGRQYLTAVILLLFELCDDPEQINMLSVSSYTDTDSCERLRRIASLIESDSNIMVMLRSVVSEPDKTRMSTLATVNSMLTRFVTNDRLLRMVSSSTIDIHSLYERPTALFLIVPDEVDTYSAMVGLMLQQISATLVSDAYRLGGKLPRRVNFVCDEFANYYVPGMNRNISAHRSRNIRWYLVCQSLKQLETCYPREADTILANCQNLYFLNSPELALLEYLSRRAGTTTVTETGAAQPLITVSDLQSLHKGWDYTDVYFTAGSRHYVAQLPDVSRYEYLSGYHTPGRLPHNAFPQVRIFSAEAMLSVVQGLTAACRAEDCGKTLPTEDHLKAERYRRLFR